MKKLLSILLICLLVLGLGACSSNESNTSLSNQDTEEQTSTQEEIKQEEVIEEVEKEEVVEETQLETKEETKREIDPEILKTYKYWVVFFDHDGNELQREALKWGTTPTYWSDIPYYSDGEHWYKFVGWKDRWGRWIKEFKPITGNTRFYAQYEIGGDTYHGDGGGSTSAPDPEYEQLTCLTTGNGNTKAYINTKVISSTNMKFEFKAKIKSGVWSYVFGNYISGTGVALAGYYNNHWLYGESYGYDSYFGTECATPSDTNLGKDSESVYEFQIKDNNSYLKVNGTTLQSVDTIVSLPTPDEIYLFAIKPVDSQTGCTIYYMKIYQDGVLVRDYIPVKTIKEIDGTKNATTPGISIPIDTLCMYDKANDMYYLNSGSTPFTTDPVS